MKGLSLPPRPLRAPDPGALVVAPITRADGPALGERVRHLVHESGADVVICDVHAVAADAVAVDVLARLQLAARRLGCRIRLRGASRELEALLGFCGVSEPLGLGLEPSGQAEEREQPRRVEERHEPGDAPL